MSISKDSLIPLTCPKCGSEHKVSLGDIAREITKPCDCGTNLVLIDEGGKAKEAIKKFDELERLLKQIGGRITIE